MIRKELFVFLVVGALTVLVDYLTYNCLHGCFGLSIPEAKGGGFLTGTVFAYFANNAWTFGHAPTREGRVWRFALLYASTLVANVLINSWVLMQFGLGAGTRQLAFLIATGVSATLNFLGMKFLVFKSTLSSQRVTT